MGLFTGRWCETRSIRLFRAVFNLPPCILNCLKTSNLAQLYDISPRLTWSIYQSMRIFTV